MNAEKPMLHKNISVSLGTLWRRLCPSEKRIYEIEAEREKIKHQLKFPDYKYRPRRKYKETGEYPGTSGNFSAPSTSGVSSQKSSFDEDNVSCYDYQNYNNFSTKYSAQYQPQNFTQGFHSNQDCFAQSYYNDQPSYSQYPDYQTTNKFEQKTNSNFNTSHRNASWQPMVTTNEVAPNNVDPFGVHTYGCSGFHDNSLFGDSPNSVQQQNSYLKPSISEFNMETNYQQETHVAVVKQPSPRLLSLEEQEHMRDVKEELVTGDEQDDVIPSMDEISFEELEPVKN